jgi:hypothetical protein
LTSEAEETNLQTPEACICEWISTEDPAFESDLEIQKFKEQYCQVKTSDISAIYLGIRKRK